MTHARFSPRALQAIDALFRRAAAAHFRLAAGEATVVARADPGDFGDADATNLIVFTMATFTFRMTAIFHVPRQLGQATHDAANGVTVLDALAEQGNLCCGAVNRELLPFYPCMGVSSPTVLHGTCASFDAAAAGGEDILRYALRLDAGATVLATLRPCAFTDIDIALDAAAPDPAPAEAVGELELF